MGEFNSRIATTFVDNILATSCK